VRASRDLQVTESDALTAGQGNQKSRGHENVSFTPRGAYLNLPRQVCRSDTRTSLPVVPGRQVTSGLYLSGLTQTLPPERSNWNASKG